MPCAARGDARFHAMRSFAATATILVGSSLAGAAPLAALTEDLDNDGNAETIEIAADGQLTIVQGTPRVKLRSDPRPRPR